MTTPPTNHTIKVSEDIATCTFTIVLAHPAACPIPLVAGCGFAGIDLSSLRRTTGDYTGNDGSYDYKMNVCGVSNSGGDCTTKSGTICQDQPGTTQLVNVLGFYSGQLPGPVWGWISDADHSLGIQMTYTNGDQCWQPGGRMITRTVIVMFPCIPGGGTSQQFYVVEDTSTCTFTIKLVTDQSCPPGPVSGCSFNGIDLSGLYIPPNSADYRGNDGTYDYEMNVCGVARSGGDCSTRGGTICQFNPGTTQLVAIMGVYSGTAPAPTWDWISQSDHSQGIQMTYINGDQCWLPGGRMVARTVILQFQCSTSTEKTFTVREDSSTCVYTLVLRTEKSCPGGPPVSDCGLSLPGGGFQDLSPLTRTSGDYTGSDATYTYSMNVCGVSNAGGDCSAKRGVICQKTGSTLTSVMAYPDSNPPPSSWNFIQPQNPSRGVMQTYTNGDMCTLPGGRVVARTVTIYYLCALTTDNTFTVTLDASSCTYSLVLKTQYSCPKMTNSTLA
jgi:hypothetical protein